MLKKSIGYVKPFKVKGNKSKKPLFSITKTLPVDAQG